MDWPEPDDAPRTPADPSVGSGPGGADPYAALRHVADEPFPAEPDTAPTPPPGDDDDLADRGAEPAEQPWPASAGDAERPPLTIPPMAAELAADPPRVESGPTRSDDAGPRGADFMAAATVSAVLEQLTSLGPRIDALEEAMRTDKLGDVRGGLDRVSATLERVTAGLDTVVGNTEHLGDVVAEASRVAVAPLAEEIGADVSRRLQDALGDLVLPVNERLSAIEASLDALVAPVNRRLEELTMRLDAIESALRVVAGRLTQSTHLQPAIESLREDVASLTVKADPRAATTGILRLVRDAVSSEMSALVRDVGVLQTAVDSVRAQVQAAAPVEQPSRPGGRAASRPAGATPLEIEPEPVRRTVRPPVPEPEGAAEHPWWREG